MKIKISAEETIKLLDFLKNCEDAEQLSNSEWVVDIYEIESPVSLDLVFTKKSVFADGAEYLSYDEDMDGYYMSGPVETAEEIEQILRKAGALG